MSSFFAGGLGRYKRGLSEQRDAQLAVISQAAQENEQNRESELIAAEVAAVQGDFHERLREAEYALF